MDEIFSLLSVLDSVTDFSKNSLFGIIFLPYWGMSNWRDLLFFLSFIMGFGWMGNISFKEYSIFCIGKIWVDWPGMDLSIFPRSRFGPSEPGFCFGLIWTGLGVAWSPPFLWA